MSRRPYRVLFLCRENGIRSQMAEGWLRALGGVHVVVRSAGIEPRHLHPLATAAMQEADVNIAAQRGKGLDAVRHERFDIVVTLCEDSAAGLPPLPGSPATEHHPVDDPSWLEDENGPVLDEFRRTRDELRTLVERVFADHLR